MSTSGDPDYEAIPTNCGPSCLDCCDCRTGLMILMDGNLPTATTYTLDDASSFVIHSINWGWTTTEPLFFGPKNEPDGSVRNTCCYRVIGCAAVTVEPFGGGTPYRTWMQIYLQVTNSRVLLGFVDYNVEDVYFFDWQRTPVADMETPLCAIPRGVASTLENILEADMAPSGSERYITGVETKTFLATPTYGNDDGGFAQGGGEAVSEPADICDCGLVATGLDWVATVTDLDICHTLNNMKPNASTWDFDISLDSACFPGVGYLDGDATGSQTGVKCDPGLGLCGTPTWEASLTLQFNPTGFTSSPMTCSLSIRTYCSGALSYELFGEAEIPFDCVNGIDTTPLAIDMYDSAVLYGTATVTFAPA